MTAASGATGPGWKLPCVASGHYGTPEVMDLLEDQGCGYIFGLDEPATPG